MSDTSELKLCPKCGGPIPGEAPQGLCPKCLLAQASIPTEADGGAGPKSAPPTQAELAAAFPQLEILELIGQGGMGFVFKARQPKLERLVALKILPQSLAADPAFAERFQREGRMLARLNHPNIVTIHDFGQANGFFYLLMEFVDGVNLRQAMRVGRFTPEQALAVVPKICEALQFAHNEGILHRDIKPENILLDAKGRVKIADFGIAKLVGADVPPFGVPPSGGPDRLKPGPQTTPAALTETGKVLGTPRYMAPEQLEGSGEVDHRADIYSLGVVFYEMLTGELPLGKFQPPSQKVRVDVRLDEVVLHALEKEPARRYQQVSEVKTAVDTIAGSAATKTSEAARTVSPTSRPDERRVSLGMAKHLMRGAKVGLLVFFLITLAGAAITLVLPESYEAVARVKLEEALRASTAPKPSYDPYLLQTEIETIQSGAILSRVIEQLKLRERWGQRYATLSTGEEVDLLKHRIDIRPAGRTQLLEIRVFSEGPKEAAEIANAIVESYVAYNSERLRAGLLPGQVLRVEILDRAVPALHPARPNRPLNIFIGAVAGVVTGIFTGIVVGLLSFWRARAMALRETCSTPIQRPNRFWRRFAVAVALVLLAMVLIPVFLMLKVIAIPNFVKWRERGQHEQTAAVQKPKPVSNLVFGPVIERTINRASTRTNFLISFKTGDLRTPPPEIASSTQAILQWSQREAVDSGVGIIGTGDVLSGFDMAVMPAPAQCWEELTPAEAASRLDVQALGSFTIMLYGNKPPFQETCAFKTRDGGIGILQLVGYVSEPPGLKIRYKFVDQVPATTQTQSNAVVTEPWSPTLWPGEKPDLRKILDEAKDLTSTGHFEEALQRHLWHYNHAQEFGDSYQNVVRLTSALSDWEKLGRRYPKAKQALIEIRDNKTREITEGRGYTEIFQEVQAINQELQNDDATFALFRTIQQQDPKLAHQCYFYVESLLVQHGEYEVCLNYMGDPQQRYDSIRQSLEMQRRSFSRMGSLPARTLRFPTNAGTITAPGPMPAPRVPMPIDTSEMMKKSSEGRFVGQVCQLIEILVGTGRKADADKIRDQAVAVLDDARLRSAISDAERKVEKIREANTAADLRAAKAKLAEQPSATFGPVVEQVVNQDKRGSDFMINFDAGRLITPPDKFPLPREALIDQGGRVATPAQFIHENKAALRWIRENGIDAAASVAVRHRSLIGFDMVSLPRTADFWDKLDPTELTRWMDGKEAAVSGTLIECNKGEDFPATCVFKTRQGAMGILQITSFTEDPRGIKIRYKLVRTTSGSTRAGGVSPPDLLAAEASSTSAPVKVFGTVTDLETGKPIAGARVVDGLYREHHFSAKSLQEHVSGKTLQETATDSNGRYELTTPVTEDHLVTVSAAGYETISIGLVATGLINQTEDRVEIQLQGPAERIDPQKVLDAARKLTKEGSYEQALLRYLWYHSHSWITTNTSASLPSELFDWVELGRSYPKARQALMEIRDHAVREFRAGHGYSKLFQEVALINAQLQNDDATYALFKTIQEQDPNLARQCYFYAESLLVQHAEYELCLNYMGDPQQRFGLIRLTSGMERIRTNTWTTPDTLEMMKKSANDRFVGKVRELVEILVGTAHKADAEKIRDQALAVLDDARLKSAISDAEESVGKKAGQRVTHELEGVKLREAIAKLDELLANYTERHPLVIEQREKIKALESK